MQQFFFPLRSAAEQKALVVWKRKASRRKTSKRNVSTLGNLPSHPGLARFSAWSSSPAPRPPPIANPQLIPVPLLCLGHKAPSHGTFLSPNVCHAPALPPSPLVMSTATVCLPSWRYCVFGHESARREARRVFLLEVEGNTLIFLPKLKAGACHAWQVSQRKTKPSGWNCDGSGNTAQKLPVPVE